MKQNKLILWVLCQKTNPELQEVYIFLGVKDQELLSRRSEAWVKPWKVGEGPLADQ